LKNSKLLFSDDVTRLIKNEDYSNALNLLFDSQIKNWQQLSNAYSSLAEVKVKSFRINNYKLKIQFNPNRLVSTSAKTDSDSVKSRNCFLCNDNLPKEQLGINYRNKFILLCNPFPIFQEHFTITSIEHQPQLIQNHFREFLSLARHLSKRYTILYNGPECGASAPDHLHFQAGTKNFLPIEDDIYQLQNEKGEIIYEDGLQFVSVIDDETRTIILFESANEDKLVKSFEKFFNTYKTAVTSSSEPMFNIIGKYDEEFGWTIICFLRSKHRPERFFKNDEQKLLVSPAAVDLGGLLITPREEDFNTIDKETLKNIFNEVSLDRSVFAALIAELKNAFK
jgi:hypothetical protein